MRTALALMVIPRSRSRSMVSRSWFCFSRSVMVPVSSSSRSARVDLPWSMWATMAKFRMWVWRAAMGLGEVSRRRGGRKGRAGVAVGGWGGSRRGYTP